jgi:hypothetical protein
MIVPQRAAVLCADAELMLLAEFVDRAPRPRDTVQRVVGRLAVSFTRWAAEHADDFR